MQYGPARDHRPDSQPVARLAGHTRPEVIILKSSMLGPPRPRVESNSYNNGLFFPNLASGL